MNQGSQPSLVNNVEIPKDTDILESKMSTREKALKHTISYDDYKEERFEKEETLRKDGREKKFNKMRINQSNKIELGTSLKDKMTIGKNIFEECSKMKVTVIKNKYKNSQKNSQCSSRNFDLTI